MTIAAASPSQKTSGSAGGPASSVALTFPNNVASGSLLTFVVAASVGPASDAPIVSDLTKTSGTATIDTVSLDLVDTRLIGGVYYLHVAIYSVLVTGAGSLTMTYANVGSSSYWIGGDEYTGSWDGTRVEDTASAQATSTAPSSGDATSAGAALFVGGQGMATGALAGMTPDAAFTQIAENEGSATQVQGSAISRIVGSGTTDAASWTNDVNQEWLALLVVYKEATGGTTITPTSGSVTLSGTAPTVTATSLSRDRPTYVGGASQVGTGATITVDLTALAGGSDSAPQEGDLVVVVWGHADTSDRTLSVSTSGYTKRQDLYQTETWDPNLATAWKFMGSTPDSSVVVNRTSNAAYGGCAVVQVWRGVDPNVPFDVADVTAQGTNSQLSNPASITPQRENAVVLACGIGTQATTGAAFTIPSGMTNGVSVKGDGTTADAAVFLASYDWTSGAYDPAAVTGGTGGTSAGWIAVTMALRGAVADGAVEITPPAGSVVLTGAAPTVIAPLLIRPAAGTLALTGAVPTLSSGSSPLITPAAGAIVLAGAVPVQTLTLPAPAPAALVLTGYAPSRLIGTNVTPGAGAVALAGAVPTVTRTANQVVTPAAGATVLAGAAPTVTRTSSATITPAAGAVALAGAVPTVTRTANVALTPGVGAVVLSGTAPTVTRTANAVLTPGAGAVVLSASAPDVTRSQSGQIQPAAGALVLTASAPIVGGSFVVRPGAGALVLGGAAPSVSAGSSRTITPASAGLVLAGAVPVIGGSYTVRPGAGAVVLAGTTPNVTVSASGQIQPAPANLVLTGAAPAVGQSYVIRPGAGATVLAGAAPTVTRTANVVAQPGAAAVLLSAAAPILVQTGNQVRTPAAGALLVTGALPQLVQSDAQAITPAAGSVVLIAFVPRVGQMFDMPRTARLGDLVAPGPDRRLGGRVAAGGARRLGARTAPN